MDRMLTDHINRKPVRKLFMVGNNGFQEMRISRPKATGRTKADGGTNTIRQSGL